MKRRGLGLVHQQLYVMHQTFQNKLDLSISFSKLCLSMDLNELPVHMLNSLGHNITTSKVNGDQASVNFDQFK